MIPSDILNLGRLKPTDTGVQPVTPSRAATDILAGLVPGQRIMAEIQAQLPNGTYRALISQREITLALPFSAKSGDSLEMEVVENNGRTAFAVVAKAAQEASTEGSVATSLSRTGQLIAELLTDNPRGGKGQATALNGNQPLLTAGKVSAETLAPALKQAVAQSGLFYEAHQARWATGQFDLNDLLKEPQARSVPNSPSAPANSSPAGNLPPQAGQTAVMTPREALPQATTVGTHPTTAPGSGTEALVRAQAGEEPAVRMTTSTPGGSLTPEVAPLVRQQLESLANNTYVWQGQVWPGQDMRWEMVEEDGKRQDDGDEAPSTWKTRLHLDLPHLGSVDIRIGLQNRQLSLHMSAGDTATREQLRQGRAHLVGRMEVAGLQLTGFTVDPNVTPNPE